jgi:hypothetical protein
MARILILTHALEDFRSRGFLMEHFARLWRAAGHEVLVHAGVVDLPDADVAVLHVDLSVVPDEYPAALAGYRSVINARPTDIRKRRFSRLLLERGESYCGPVILKTDLNCGGFPEWHVLQRQIELGHRQRDRSYGWMRRYPVYGSIEEVPEGAWDNPGYVVERFVPERDDRGFWLRQWTFLGERERCHRLLGTHPIVKARDALERIPAPVPEELRTWRSRLGFDYGKFDFVLHAGEPVLLDVNRTPTTGPAPTDAMREGIAHLAQGITSFLGRGAPRARS